jgi:flagellar basal-body rod modification protein FlgD
VIASTDNSVQQVGQNNAGNGSQTSALADQFLKLLLTQLEHQDPMNPMDSREFTTQLAQFSMLEQAVQSNQALQALKGYEESANNARTLNLLGREVRVSGNRVQLKEGRDAAIHFNLPQASNATTAVVYDAWGQQVRTIELGPRDAGLQQCVWDGRDQLGNMASPGVYQVAVMGEDVGGEQFSAGLFMEGTVEAVQFTDGQASPVVAGVPVSMEEILEVNGYPE